MMVLALAMSAPVAEGAPTAEPEITVIARKLAKWRGNWAIKRGHASCKTSKSTGDREIDAVGCSAILDCMPRFQSQFQALADAKLPKAVFAARAEPINKQFGVCITGEREAGIAALADRRAGSAK